MKLCAALFFGSLTTISLLADSDYVELVTKKIPKFALYYHNLDDRGLFWEMIKMEIRATIITYAKGKAREKRDEDKCLLT